MSNVIGGEVHEIILAGRSWEVSEQKNLELVVYDDDDTYRQAEECQTQISYIYIYIHTNKIASIRVVPPNSDNLLLKWYLSNDQQPRVEEQSGVNITNHSILIHNKLYIYISIVLYNKLNILYLIQYMLIS